MYYYKQFAAICLKISSMHPFLVLFGTFLGPLMVFGAVSLESER